jgi:hypothetical protein
MRGFLQANLPKNTRRASDDARAKHPPMNHVGASQKVHAARSAFCQIRNGGAKTSKSFFDRAILQGRRAAPAGHDYAFAAMLSLLSAIIHALDRLEWVLYLVLAVCLLALGVLGIREQQRDIGRANTVDAEVIYI